MGDVGRAELESHKNRSGLMERGDIERYPFQYLISASIQSPFKVSRKHNELN